MTNRTLIEINRHQNIGFFYNSFENWYTVIIPIIKDAINKGEKVIYIYDEHSPSQIKQLLNNSYIDEKIKKNQINFLKAEDIYVKDNLFSPKLMIKSLIEETNKAIDEGFISLFVTDEMSWVLKFIEGSERLIEYEEKLNQEFFGNHKCTLICQYNWEKFSSSTLLDLIKIHPYILYDNEILKNLFFIKGDSLIDEDCKKKWMDKILKFMSFDKEKTYRIKELENIIINQPHIGFAILTDFPLRILIVNKGVEKILGFNKDDLLKISSDEFISHIYEQDRDSFIEAYKSVLDSQKHSVLPRVRFIRKNGDLIYLRMIFTPIKFMDLDCSEVSFIDITENLIREEEIQQLREQFLFAQRMESIGRMSAGIAHDFNNILTAIRGFTQLAQFKVAENDPIKQYLDNVQLAAEKAEKLVKQLLAFSRRQILQTKVININDLISSMEEMLKRIIGEDIIFLTELSSDLGLVEVDPVQIEQVIVNIIVNARDAMPKGGKIVIETKNVDLDDNYVNKHHGSKKGAHVMLAITDTGIGIPEEIRDKIFEPFFSTKKEKGTGLGLSTVYGIVKQHGGNIWVYSEINQGTTFKIYFPRVDKEIEQDKFEHYNEEILRGTETILIIDDDEKIRDILISMLKMLGYEMLEAKNIESALYIANTYTKDIDLIISDIVMPGMSGPALFNKIKQIRPESKVLYISGYTDNVISHHGILDKGINFIQKPFTIQALSRKIREVIEKTKP